MTELLEVIRDKDGNVINIGPWEYNYVHAENPDRDSLLWSDVRIMMVEGKNPDLLYDSDGKAVMVALNPLPDGAISATEEVVDDVDKGKVPVADYRTQRRLAYPTYGDQHDMQFHDLINETTVWRDTIQEVKDRYPKP